MKSKIRKWPTKGEAVYVGIFTALMLVSNWISVLYEGRAATGFYWAVQSIGIALLVASVWLYVRAAKHSSKPTR